MSTTYRKLCEGYHDGTNNLENLNKYKEGSRNFKAYQEGYDKGYAEYQDRRAQQLNKTKLLIKRHPCLYDFIKYAKEHKIDFLARNITITDLNGCHLIHGYEIQSIYDFWDEL